MGEVTGHSDSPLPRRSEVAMYTAGLLGGGANKRHEDPGRGERVAHMLAKVTL